MTEFNLYRVYYYSAPQYNWDVRIDLYMSGAAVGTLLFMKTGQPIFHQSFPGHDVDIKRGEAALC